MPLKAGAIVAIATLSLAVSGCGFRPLYATPPGVETGSTAGVALASIAVAEPVDRTEQRVRNELVFLLNNGRPPVAPRYTLDLVVTQSVVGLAVEPVSGRPTAANLTMTATAVVTDLNGQAVLTDTVTTKASLDLNAQRFASQRAETDASERAAKTAARLLHTRIGAAFATGRLAEAAGVDPA